MASLQLSEVCRDLKIDYVLIQEPCIINQKVYGFESCRRSLISKDAGAAIIVLTRRYQSISLSSYSSNHTVAIRVIYGPRPLDQVVLVSAYFKYNIPTALHIERLNQILVSEKRTLIGADTNGHSNLWHSLSRNRRCRLTEEFIDKHGLMVHNLPGQLNTFCRKDGRTSNIDATLTTADIKLMVKGWQVKDLTDSDHRVISFKLATTNPPPKVPPTTRYTKSADWEMFNSALLGELGSIPDGDAEELAVGINRVLKIAADRAIPVKRSADVSGKNPWWSPVLTTLRQSLARVRRQGLRETDRPGYRKLRNEFLSEIRKHKLDAWKAFAGDLNSNPWSKAFTWAKCGSREKSIPNTVTREDGSQTADCRETAELFLDKFVPPDPAQGNWCYQGPLENKAKPDSVSIKAAIWRIKPSSAPGADGITAGILRKAWPALQELIIKLFGLCVSNGIFPECWKAATLVLIPKPGKIDASMTKSYRPISLLPTLGKALETIIIQNINDETHLDSHE